METVIHVAAPLDQATLTQRCARCGAALALPDVFRWEDWEYEMESKHNPNFQREKVYPPRRVFTPGDLVESCRHGVCLVLVCGAVPTCQPRVASQVAA